MANGDFTTKLKVRSVYRALSGNRTRGVSLEVRHFTTKLKVRRRGGGVWVIGLEPMTYRFTVCRYFQLS